MSFSISVGLTVSICTSLTKKKQHKTKEQFLYGACKVVEAGVGKKTAQVNVKFDVRECYREYQMP